MVPLDNLWCHCGTCFQHMLGGFTDVPRGGKVMSCPVVKLDPLNTFNDCPVIVFVPVCRWYRARHGSLMVAAASAGTAAVRKKDPAHYPAAPHAYYRLGDHELHAPVLCAACFERVEPNNLFQVNVQAMLVCTAFAYVAQICSVGTCWCFADQILKQMAHKCTLCMQRGSCCEICGVICHEGCVKQAPEDCRPIALAADKILHTWKAAGTVMTETPVSSLPAQPRTFML